MAGFRAYVGHTPDGAAVEDLKLRRKAYHNRHKVIPSPHWTNNPDADGTVEDLEPASPVRALSPEDAEVLAAIEAFEGKYGPGSFRWSWAGAKELFYSTPGDHWPEPDQLLRIRHHVEDNRNAEFVFAERGEV